MSRSIWATHAITFSTDLSGGGGGVVFDTTWRLRSRPRLDGLAHTIAPEREREINAHTQQQAVENSQEDKRARSECAARD